MSIPEGVLTPHPAVETAFLSPEAVLWDSRHERVLHFNRSASAVWLCVDGELTADQIAMELSEIFEVPIDVIRPDVDKALADFVELGLLAGDVDERKASTGSSDAADDGTEASSPAQRPTDGRILARPPDP